MVSEVRGLHKIHAETSSSHLQEMSEKCKSELHYKNKGRLQICSFYEIKIYKLFRK